MSAIRKLVTVAVVSTGVWALMLAGVGFAAPANAWPTPDHPEVIVPTDGPIQADGSWQRRGICQGV